MKDAQVRFEELWEPWHLGEDARPTYSHVIDIPDGLVERFQKAKAEMEEVWEELRKLLEQAEEMAWERKVASSE